MIREPYRSITSNTTLNAYDYHVDIASSGVTVTLPTASGLLGKCYELFYSEILGTVTIDGNGSETIDGQVYYYLQPKQGITIFSDGSNWKLMTGNRTSLPNAFGALWRRGAAANTLLNMTGGAVTTYSGTGVLPSNDINAPYLIYTCNNTTGSIAGFESSAFNWFRSDHNPMLQFVFRTEASLANGRIWFGLSTVTLGNTDNQSGQSCLFRYSTIAGDSAWMPINDDGTQSIGSAMSSVSINKMQRGFIYLDRTNGIVHYMINGVYQTIATNVPASGQDMGFVWGFITNENVSKQLSMSRFQITSS